MKVRLFIQIMLIAIGVYMIVVAGVFFFQRLIVFQPEQLEKNHSFSFPASFEEHWLETKDGVRINGLFFPTSAGPSKGLILYFHGNRGHLQRWGNEHTDFTSRGYDIFIIDYRSYGKSQGRATEPGLYQDAQSAYRWASERYSSDQIVLYGRSLGAAVASHLATKVDARMLILETPFYSFRDAVRKKVPWLWTPYSFEVEFPNYRHIQQLDYPVHIFHGTSDRLVRYSSAVKLKPLLDCADCFVTIEGGGHRDLSDFSEFQTYLDKIL